MTDILRLRLSGLFVLLAFPLFGFGQALLGGDYRELGLLMALTNSGAVIAIGFLMRPIIARTFPTTANIYLIARTLEGTFLAMSSAAAFGGVLSVGADAEVFYQRGMIALGLGSVPMCWWLIHSGLVPKMLGQLGLVGYICLIGAMIAGMNDAETVSTVLLLPGAVFELAWGLLFVFARPKDQSDVLNPKSLGQHEA